MSLEEALACVLREERLAKGFSQEELAHRCELDRTYISLIERKKRKPTVSVIFKICETLGIKPSCFIKKIEKMIFEAISEII